MWKPIASIAKAVFLKVQYERRSGQHYDLAMLMRYDLAWHADVVWPEVPRAQFWVVAQCCGFQRDPVSTPAVSRRMSEAFDKVDRVCIVAQQNERGTVGEIMDYCRVSRYMQPVYGTLATAEAELNYNVNDWLVLAPSKTLDMLRLILPNFDLYSAALDELSIRPPFLHYFFGVHIHDALRASAGLRGAPVHVSLIRNVRDGRCYSNVSVRHLLPPPSKALSSPLFPGMDHVCPFRGQIRCHVHSRRCALQRNMLLPAFQYHS